MPPDGQLYQQQHSTPVGPVQVVKQLLIVQMPPPPVPPPPGAERGSEAVKTVWRERTLRKKEGVPLRHSQSGTLRMAQSLIPTGAETLIEGGAAGPISVGRYNVRLHPRHGAIVSLPSPESPPAPAPGLTTSDEFPAPGTVQTPVDEATVRQGLAPLPDEEKRVLSALAAVGGGPVEGVHLAVLADVPDPRPALDALVARQLVAAHSPRYSLTGNLASLLPSLWDLSPWRERALAYFLPWAEARREDSAALLAEAVALRHLLDWAAEAGRQAEAVRLGRTLDAPLALSGRWGAWAQALERVRVAAMALGDRAAEGWALHQLGTRLLCLDDKHGARQLLTRALAIRKSLVDRAGAAVTRHNLGLLSDFAIGVIRIPPVSFRMLPWLAAVVLLVLVGAIRFASSRMGEPLQQRRQTAVPMAGGVPVPEGRFETPPIAQEMTTDLPSSSTSDVEEPAPPPLTTDHTAEEAADEALIEVPHNLEFPTLTLGTAPGTPVEVLSMRNTGTNPLRVAGMSFIENPGQAFTMRSGCARHPIPPGERCLVQVFFHPPAVGHYRGVLAIDAEGLERQTVAISGTAKEPVREPPREPSNEPLPEPPDQPVIAPVPVLGWCCVSGEVNQSSKDDCEDDQGAFFRGQRQATAACLIVGCCVDGDFKLGETRERCDELGGKFMSATEVPLRCKR